ncbi:MAG TPA: double-strand break repair helicase AddA [Pseudolabrys sp.]|nr:double-strand break repair helicase AddA [Pseudolabrys sp.]
MTAARTIPEAVLTRQIAAADPERSIFVSANAGSGKTHVLVQRIIGLMLRGEDPAKILCITFTKAAAANMATRVFGTLAQWAVLEDAALDKEIRQATGSAPTPGQRARARRLFASALETPGGLKVQTIHAFCTRLLHQFPFEADVAARFEVLDEPTTAQLLNQLTLEVILEGASHPESPLGKALTGAVIAAADITFKEVIAETIGKRDRLTAWTERAGGVQPAIDELTRLFGLAPGDTMAAVEADYLNGSLIPQNEWPEIAAVLAESDKQSDRDIVESLETARKARGRDAVAAYRQIFCTANLARRKSVLTAKFAKANAALHERLLAEQDRVCALIAREMAVAARDRSAALITVASAVIERYRHEKDRRGLLDYDDLIDKTLALFERSSAAWVLYKLDLGINHVLIDEAQDTSPKQWLIIKTIVDEFLPGGARDNVRRTVFAVGDEKQSIFSFQGAAPLAFDETRRYFAARFAEFDSAFAQERLEYSFRSSPVVLHAVDTVFAREEAFHGLSHDRAKTVHQAVYRDAPGHVEIWDLIAADPKDEDKEGWDAPFDLTSETTPSVKLAAKIARTVKAWTGQGVRPRDVLILVRQRGPAFEAVIRALKRERIEVAGADRLTLTEHIAIMDLLVLGDALLLPDDDLALATVLKSPLFGLTEEQLFALAYGRKTSLRNALRAQAGGDPQLAAVSAMLDELARKARALTPFAFYAHVLGAGQGRRRIQARLGIEAADPLDEFLNLALVYEQRQTPSLQGFLNWLRAAQSEVKRDMEIARDEVRVMTVHGAKGLEAKNVILIDATTTRPEGAHPPRLLIAPIPGAPPDSKALIWGAAKDKDAGPMAAARSEALDAARDEYRRLLYVGLTRAAERLVVCGVKGVNKIPAGCWYELVGDALKPLSSEETDADGGKVWRFSKDGTVETVSATAKAAALPALPDWLRANASSVIAGVRTVTPSSAEEETGRAATGASRAAALMRGSLTHRLLQALPDIAAERRGNATEEFLARAGKALAEHLRREIEEEVDVLLNHAAFAALFAPGSRAEVPIVGRLNIGGETIRVSGQVDRLAVTQDAVLIADFKTNRPAPRRLEDVPPGYVRQLALYRAVLMKLYPGKSVRAALIWTEVPDLMELSTEALDAALAQITSAR